MRKQEYLPKGVLNVRYFVVFGVTFNCQKPFLQSSTLNHCDPVILVAIALTVFGG